MKKQVCSAILLLALVFTTVSCGTGPIESGNTSDTTAVSDECTDNTTEEDSHMNDMPIPEESNNGEVTGKDESSTTSGGPNNTTGTTGTSRPLITRPVVPGGSEGDNTTESDPTVIGLPDAYKTANIVYDCDDGSVLYNYTGKTKKDFDAVCAYYTQKGFKIYNSHSMGENTATTFVGDGPMAHIYWFKAKSELNIVLSNTAAYSLPPATPAVTDGKYACTVVQIMDNAHSSGMSYVVQLEDGSYIIYDGAYASQADKLEKYLLDNHKGDGKPIIRAWVLTHSHNDHYPTFKQFATTAKYSKQFTVEYVIFAPLNDAEYILNNEDDDPYFSTQLYEDVKGLKGAELVFAHTGMLFNFCNLKMEILLSPETLYMRTPMYVGNFNNTSIVSRLYDDNYSALFLGDIAIAGSNYMHSVYGSYLKSDMCQVSHHGVEDVPLSFYEEVKASILYYPCNVALYNHQSRNDDVRIALENRDYTKEILIAGCGQYKRAWGTKFAADAPLSMPDYTVPPHKQPGYAPLSTNKTTYKVGEPIMVTAVGSGTDWVGIQSVEKFNGGEGAAFWWYVTSTGSGAAFDVLSVTDETGAKATLPAGKYILRLIANNNAFQNADRVLSETYITIEK